MTLISPWEQQGCEGELIADKLLRIITVCVIHPPIPLPAASHNEFQPHESQECWQGVRPNLRPLSCLSHGEQLCHGRH